MRGWLLVGALLVAALGVGARWAPLPGPPPADSASHAVKGASPSLDPPAVPWGEDSPRATSPPADLDERWPLEEAADPAAPPTADDLSGITADDVADPARLREKRRVELGRQAQEDAARLLVDHDLPAPDPALLELAQATAAAARISSQ